jgi:hypothetical protein
MSDSPRELLLKYVEADLNAEWQRRSSIETKALAVITANLGVATLYFALRTQLGLESISKSSFVAVCVVLALVATACSIGLAVAAVAPRKFPAASVDALSKLSTYIQTHDKYPPERAIDNLLAGRIADLKTADTANNHKAKWFMAAVTAIAVSSILLIVSLAASNANSRHAAPTVGNTGSTTGGTGTTVTPMPKISTSGP